MMGKIKVSDRMNKVFLVLMMICFGFDISTFYFTT